MEQTTPPVKVSAPPTIKIDWHADEQPYVEVWSGKELLLAGWVYDATDYVKPPTVSDYYQVRQGNIVQGDGQVSPFGPVQAGLVTPQPPFVAPPGVILTAVPELDDDLTGEH